MSLTITFSDPLADSLRTRAEVENIPVEQLASRLLETGIQKPLSPERWEVVNDRRGALIEKRFSAGLTHEEQAELQQLQILADRQLEELDANMLRDLSVMEARARKVINGAE